MKQVLIWALNIAYWILRIIITPFRFIQKLLWPYAKPYEADEVSNPPGSLPASENEIEPASMANLEKPIHPAISEPRTIGREKPIKPAIVVKPGWFSLPLEILPNPTYWPVVLGLGLVFGVFGLVTNFIFSLVGIVLFILGIAGWIGDMWNEQSE